MVGSIVCGLFAAYKSALQVDIYQTSECSPILDLLQATSGKSLYKHTVCVALIMRLDAYRVLHVPIVNNGN